MAAIKQRGRKSAAALAVVPMTPRGAADRIAPPTELTDDEAEVWRAIVTAEAPDHFSASTVPMLAQYCRHVVSAKRVSGMIERANGKTSIVDLDRLLQMQSRESRTIQSLATKMRISQQATTNFRGNKKPTRARKLWDR